MVMIVGQAPGRSRGSALPLEGPSGDRLARLAGMSGHDDLRRRATLVNLLPGFPGKSGKGDAFPLPEARLAAFRMRLGRGRVLLAGKAVARAFGLQVLPYFRWTRHRRAWLAVIPHPSGVSHWWNEPRNVRRARRFMRSVFA